MTKATKRMLLLLVVLVVLPLAGCLDAFAEGFYRGAGGYQPAYYQQPQQPYNSLSAEHRYYLQQQLESYDRSTSSTYSPSTSYTPTSSTYSPSVGENGSYYGQLNDNGVPKTVYVRGYYRKDGTYVRSHYRSAPGSNPW